MPPVMTNRFLDATVKVNGRKLLHGRMPWRVDLMQDRFNKVLGNEFLESFSIQILGWGQVGVYPSVINEMLGLILMQDLSRNGI